MRWIDIHDVDDAEAAVRHMRRMPRGEWSGPLVIGNPTGDLRAAESEASHVGEMLGVEPLIGPEATVAAVLNALPKASIIHLAAHAQLNREDPMATVVQLADGTITARDLIGAYCEAALVVLSVCEGAATRRGVGGEVVGLANALLRSGARAVVAPLWRADDDATAFLMTAFYYARLSGAADAAALVEAKRVTSQQPGWGYPYFWSGFIVMESR